MPTITYDSARSISAEQLASIFTRSGINRPTHNLVRMQKMVDTADHLVTAWDGDQLVERVRAGIGADPILLLLAAPTAMGYYPKIGFDAVENGFIIRPVAT
jgi:hypothetical protein